MEKNVGLVNDKLKWFQARENGDDGDDKTDGNGNENDDNSREDARIPLINQSHFPLQLTYAVTLLSMAICC